MVRDWSAGMLRERFWNTILMLGQSAMGKRKGGSIQDCGMYSRFERIFLLKYCNITIVLTQHFLLGIPKSASVDVFLNIFTCFYTRLDMKTGGIEHGQD